MSLQARCLDSLAGIEPARWDALHDQRNPFLAHAFLEGLERHGCLRPEWGWTARHLTLWEGDALVAAAPGYLKTNSHGEFVFDHAWAHAYAQHGLEYFPKWLFGVPYSPVTGPRLLAPTDRLRRALVEAMADLTAGSGLSSAHVNFHPGSEAAAFDDAWLARADIQYHWHNPGQWRDFDGFLAAMDHRHRKNIRQERARVARAGVRFRRLSGAEAGEAELDAIHRFYLQTFLEYGNAPALTRAFIAHLAREMAGNLLIVLGYLDDEPVAGALCLRGGDTLYGRYWGSDVSLPGLHFETCYYQGIEYCLEQGLARFEPGAQGEHKLARGFLPTLVHSHHHVVDPRFARALREWCADERASVRQHAEALARRGPFRVPAPG